MPEVHPKDVLYDQVYDPLTRIWFRELEDSLERKELLAEAPKHDLLENLLRLDEVFRVCVDRSLDSLGAKADDILGTMDTHRIVEKVGDHRQHVMWANEEVPEEGAGPEQIRASLSHKLKRNISLGALEAVICLESALEYGRDKLGLTGDVLADTLRRSRQLYGSLAYLHDEQEWARLKFLTNKSGYLRYTDGAVKVQGQGDGHGAAPVSYKQVIVDREYQIPFDKFVVIGSPEALRLRFVSAPAQPDPASLDSPIKRCPAQRLRRAEGATEVLNDVLWDLLIDIYRLSHRFD